MDWWFNPYRVLALRGSHHLDFHCGWRKGCEFLCHAFTDACEHCGASGKNDICIEVLANIHVALHNGLESGVMDAARLLANETWLEKNFRAAEPLIADSDDVSIWKLVGLLLVRAFGRCFHFTIEVQSDVGELFLNIPHYLTLCCRCEGVP